jgi:hypothetical protein
MGPTFVVALRGTPPAVKNWDAVWPWTTVGVRRVTPRIPCDRATGQAKSANNRATWGSRGEVIRISVRRTAAKASRRSVWVADRAESKDFRNRREIEGANRPLSTFPLTRA